MEILNNEITLPFDLNLIHPGDGWILEKMALQLKKYIPQANIVSAREINLNSLDSSIFSESSINYYIHYNLFQAKSSGIDCAWFTHIEEDIPSLVERFHSVAKTVDLAIFNCQRYADICEDETKNAVVLVPGIENQFFDDRLILGVVGRLYDYTPRKNLDLMKKVSGLPYAQVRLTNGKLPPEKLPEFYRACDYIFVPSTIEGGPMSLIECLAMGKEIIFPKDVGMAGMFDQGVHLYEKNDFGSLEQLLVKLHSKKTYISKQVEEYTWRNWADRHIEHFVNIWKRYNPNHCN